MKTELDILIITGASKGIGRAILERFNGQAQAIIAISRSGLETDTVAQHGNFVCVDLKGDVASPDIAHRVQEEVLRFLGGADDKARKAPRIGFVSCAALLGKPGGVARANTDEWLSLFGVNVLAPLKIFRSVATALGGYSATFRCVFLAGGGAAFPYPEFFGYSLTKVAVVRSVENLAQEFKESFKDFSVVALAPGAVKTDMLAQVEAAGGKVNTRTDISEPVNFVWRFLTSRENLNDFSGRFLHVRDDWDRKREFQLKPELFTLRRIS